MPGAWFAGWLTLTEPSVPWGPPAAPDDSACESMRRVLISLQYAHQRGVSRSTDHRAVGEGRKKCGAAGRSPGAFMRGILRVDVYVGLDVRNAASPMRRSPHQDDRDVIPFTRNAKPQQKKRRQEQMGNTGHVS